MSQFKLNRPFGFGSLAAPTYPGQPTQSGMAPSVGAPGMGMTSTAPADDPLAAFKASMATLSTQAQPHQGMPDNPFSGALSHIMDAIKARFMPRQAPAPSPTPAIQQNPDIQALTSMTTRSPQNFGGYLNDIFNKG